MSKKRKPARIPGTFAGPVNVVEVKKTRALGNSIAMLLDRGKERQMRSFGGITPYRRRTTNR